MIPGGRVASLLATGNTYIHNTLEEVVGYMMLHTYLLAFGDWEIWIVERDYVEQKK